jgi:uncharacterized membrane protein YidH (DUF202 family)
MKPIAWLGVLLIVLGGLALAYQGFNYNHDKQIMDVGSMHITAETQRRVSIPPIVGGLALLGGVVLLVAGIRKTN